ncbi:hypothetical protein FVER53590_00538 [Fusarium verticillioides]|nr:hypothetical protein FVER53590_00538 [Fusarium verticillioides]
MSNPAVGNVYQAIIDEVVNSSRVDFEESGVEESVLEELRQPEGNNIKTEPHVPIKQEPGLQDNTMTYQQYNNNTNINMNDNNVAANRAAQQLQAQYGQRAASSINALHQQQGHSQQNQQQPALPQPHQQPQPGLTQQQHQQQQIYRQQMAAATAQQQPQHPANGQPHIQNGQTDGAGDLEEFDGVLMQRAADGNLHELGRVEIDRMLHEKILAQAKSMEGGGLMLPLKEATRTSSVSTSRKIKGKQPAAYDGGDDDDEDDEDAINSDLDDPEEDRDDDDVDDEGLGNIMLCMYDKVQRVKNKWKCTLKDGVLTVNGKEYVFHKATGEYEW